MQNVVCPTMIVQIDNVMPVHWNAEFSTTPVMTPGRASGKIKSSDIESRPKNLALCTPKAANDPSSRASAVATTAALMERTNAERTCGSFHATEYQCVVQC